MVWPGNLILGSQLSKDIPVYLIFFLVKIEMGQLVRVTFHHFPDWYFMDPSPLQSLTSVQLYFLSLTIVKLQRHAPTFLLASGVP